MADIKVGNGSISILSLIAMVGALLAFIGFFLAITKFKMTYGGFTDTTDAINGLDFLNNTIDGHKVDDAFKFWKVMPLLTMLVALATIILGILPMFGVNNSGVKMEFMVCAIITFVFALLVFICTAGTAVLNADTVGQEYINHTKGVRQIGAYFMLIGGLAAAGCTIAEKCGVKL